MNQDKQKVLERLKKLLRMAEDTSSPNEAAIAAARAAKLMEKYQIDNKEAILAEIESGENFSVESHAVGKRVPRWLTSLYIQVAKSSDCIVRAKKLPSGTVYEYCGFKDDVELAGFTLEFLKNAVNRLADKAYKEYKKDGGEVNGQSWKASYREGAAAAMIHNLREAKEASKQEQASSGTGLMVVKEKAVAAHFGRANYSSRTKYVKNDSARAQGYRDGKQVKVNKAIAN